VRFASRQPQTRAGYRIIFACSACFRETTANCKKARPQTKGLTFLPTTPLSHMTMEDDDPLLLVQHLAHNETMSDFKADALAIAQAFQRASVSIYYAIILNQCKYRNGNSSNHEESDHGIIAITREGRKEEGCVLHMTKKRLIHVAVILYCTAGR
jgi:hypothetical protein